MTRILTDKTIMVFVQLVYTLTVSDFEEFERQFFKDINASKGLDAPKSYLKSGHISSSCPGFSLSKPNM